MHDIDRKLDAVFFRTEKGNEPVREWLLSLPKFERKMVGDDVLDDGAFTWVYQEDTKNARI